MIYINLVVAILFLFFTTKIFSNAVRDNLSFVHAFIKVFLLIIFIGSIYLGYFRFIDGEYTNKVIVFQGDILNLKTEKSQYKPGEMVKAYISFCKYRNVAAEVQDALLDDSLTLYPDKVIDSSIIGCRENLLVSLEPIVLNAAPTTYHLSRTLRYQVNNLRIIEFSLKTAEFTVVK